MSSSSACAARGAPPGQRAAPRGQRAAAVLAPAAPDRRLLAQRLCGRALCAAPAARRVGGLGGRAQGRAEHVLRPARAAGLRLRYAAPPRRYGRSWRCSSRWGCWPSRCWSRCPWSCCCSTSGRSGAAPSRAGPSGCPPAAAEARRSSREKLPFFLLYRRPALTVAAQSGGGAVRRPPSSGLPSVCSHALLAFVPYLRQDLWPLADSPSSIRTRSASPLVALCPPGRAAALSLAALRPGRSRPC